MRRLGLLGIQCLFCSATASKAATVQSLVRWIEPEGQMPPEREMGTETLVAIIAEHAFDAGLVAAPNSPVLAAAQVVLVVTLVASISRRLPRVRQPFGLWRYAAAAFPASSWIRATIARRPLERCDDKWSCKPSRPSSAPASTFRTSRTANPP